MKQKNVYKKKIYIVIIVGMGGMLGIGAIYNTMKSNHRSNRIVIDDVIQRADQYGLHIGNINEDSVINDSVFKKNDASPYGDVVDQYARQIDNSIVERVTLYSQENDQSNKKIIRNGVLVRNKDAQATILIAHGFMCDKYYAGFFRSIFPQGEYNFMTFDFRAHGDGVDGQYCTFGHDEAYDVIAAAKFVKNHPDLADMPLYVYGFSMGAVASIEAQAKEPSLFDAMILDCPFDSSENVIKNGLKELRVTIFGYEFTLPGKEFLEKNAFHPYVQSLVRFALKVSAGMDTRHIQTQFVPLSPVESIKKVVVPCLFIHCKNDDKVSVAAVKSIFDNASGYKKLWITNGRGHFDSFFYYPELYVDNVQKFLMQVRAGELASDDDGLIMEDDVDEYIVAHKVYV